MGTDNGSSIGVHNRYRNERTCGNGGTGSKWDGRKYPANGMGEVMGREKLFDIWDGKQDGNEKTGGYYFGHRGPNGVGQTLWDGTIDRGREAFHDGDGTGIPVPSYLICGYSRPVDTQ